MSEGQGREEHDLTQEESALASWSLLKAHYKRGALVWVSPELDLNEVGQAVVADDKIKVESWMTGGKLTPFPQDLASKEPSMQCFIAQPWVLVQEV